MTFLILVVMLILMAVGFAIGKFALKGDVATIVTLIIGVAVTNVLMPSSLFELSTLMYNMLSTTMFFIGLIVLYIFAGLTSSAGYRLSKLMSKPERTNGDLAVGVAGVVVLASPVIWLITFLIDIASLYAYRIRIPHLYNLFFWTVIICILIAIKLFVLDKGVNVGASTSAVIKTKANQTKNQEEAKRKADVILYKDNLEALDEDLKAGIVSRERYAQIICDIEMEQK